MVSPIIILAMIPHHVNRPIMMKKNTLHILSVIAALFFAIHYYKLDKKCFFEGYIFFIDITDFTIFMESMAI